MKIVQPITSEQEILIIPREDLDYSNLDFKNRVIADGGTVSDSSCVSTALAEYNDVDMIIKKDGQNTTETISNLVVTELSNYFKVSFSSTILEEGFGYSIALTKDGSLFYRDKLYVTSQTDFTIKHKQSQNKYTEVVDDNTYVI